MKMKKNKLLLLLLMLSLLLTACGKEQPTIGGILADGAEDFGEGKSDKDLPFISSEELLAKLMDEYSDSRENPTGGQMSADDADRIRKEKEEEDQKDAGQSGGSTPVQTTPVVASRRDLKDLVHRMLDNTEEVASFELSGGYQLTTDEVLGVYYELERDDPMDAISLASFQYGGSPIVTLKFNYHIDVDQLKEMKDETRDLLKEAVSKVDVEGLSQYEIVCAVNDYLCDTVVYPPNEPYAAETHTPYNAFKTGSAVCDGYSKAAKLMLNHFGVECDFVIGDCIQGGGHAWNLVKLDGEWYHLDVTWNDGGAEWDADARTEYLLVTDAFMAQSRTWDTSIYPASAATAYVK